MSFEAMVEAQEAIPPGVIARHRTGPFHPVRIPYLIGVRERRYLDRPAAAPIEYTNAGFYYRADPTASNEPLAPTPPACRASAASAL